MPIQKYTHDSQRWPWHCNRRNLTLTFPNENWGSICKNIALFSSDDYTPKNLVPYLLHSVHRNRNFYPSTPQIKPIYIVSNFTNWISAKRLKNYIVFDLGEVWQCLPLCYRNRPMIDHQLYRRYSSNYAIRPCSQMVSLAYTSSKCSLRSQSKHTPHPSKKGNNRLFCFPFFFRL